MALVVLKRAAPSLLGPAPAKGWEKNRDEQFPRADQTGG